MTRGVHNCGWRRWSPDVEAEQTVVSDRQGLILYDMGCLEITEKQLVFYKPHN